MEFKFDEQSFRRFHYITIPMSGVIAIIIAILSKEFQLNPLVFILLFLPFVMHAVKFKGLNYRIEERRSEKVSIDNGKVFYTKESSGYKFERSLNDVISVKNKRTFFIPVVVVQFTNNEQFKFYWFTEPEKLCEALKSGSV